MTHQVADECSTTRARPRCGDDMQPSTPGLGLKEKLYHHGEGHSHTSATRAHVRWLCGTLHKQPYTSAAG
jgi:hypothetical protein